MSTADDAKSISSSATMDVDEEVIRSHGILEGKHAARLESLYRFSDGILGGRLVEESTDVAMAMDEENQEGSEQNRGKAKGKEKAILEQHTEFFNIPTFRRLHILVTHTKTRARLNLQLEFEPIQPDSETIGDVDRWEDDDNFEGNHDEGDEEPIVRRRLRRRYHWDKPEGSTSQFREHSQSQSDTEEDPSIDQEIYLGSRERSVTLGRDTPPPHPPEHGQSQSDARGDQLIDQEGIWLRARQRSTSLRSRSLSPPTIIVGELASAIHQQSPDRVPHPRRKKVTVPRSYNTIDTFKRMVGSLDGPEYWLT
ncbi:hypothetical protein F5Y08DRAFT_338080 [Xylaria arbuscula]|nr:hypothetical protein F5Y08DRAFT_338080 [Xylaria arbuscula]